jgi:DNA helicase II / ATP-dependent DNA helicase PcrA
MQKSNSFETALSNLNAAQLEAVNNFQGPMMVIAGPGTGKTQLLTTRISKICSDRTIANPSNILCLTYTDSAAKEMHARLTQWMGDEAYQVSIHTFHAFCNRVIQDNEFLFPFQNGKPISKIESIELWSEVLESLPAGHRLVSFKSDPFKNSERLIQFYDLLQKESITDLEMIRTIDKELEALKNSTTKASKTNAEALLNSRAASELIPLFKNKMLQRGYYTFYDMLHSVVCLLETDDDMRAEFQERYQYILVDEFQDSNSIQNKLLFLLTKNVESPNIMVVGDDDQSIYRFQGANIRNLKEYYEQFKNDLKIVVLTENYRSTQLILNAAMHLISNSTQSIRSIINSVEKRLISKSPNKTDIPISVGKYVSVEHEYIGVANRIKEQLNNNISPSEIAVLYKEHKCGLRLVPYLQHLNIPYVLSREENMLTLPVIKNAVQIINYVCNEIDAPFSGTSDLYEILHQETFELDAIELCECVVQVKKRYSERSSLRKALTDKTWINSLNSKSINRIAAASDLIEILVRAAVTESPQQWMHRWISTLQPYKRTSNESELDRAEVIKAWMNWLEAEITRTGITKMGELRDLLEKYILFNVPIPVTRILGGSEGVKLMTCHNAKGMEFGHVYMINLSNNLWEKKRSNSNSFSLPEYFKETDDTIKLEESRRLFYVGLTRAKETINLSYGGLDENGKTMIPTQFISELPQPLIEHLEIKFSPDTETILHSIKPLHRPKLLQDNWILQQKSQFKWSASSLNTFLECKNRFYYNNLLGIPSITGDAAAWGTCIHNTLEKLINYYIKSDTWISDYELKKVYLNELTSQQQYLKSGSWSVKANWFEFGFLKYLAIRKPEWALIKNLEVEKSLSGTHQSGIQISGRIDKVTSDSMGLCVVDYKTVSKKDCDDKKYFVLPNEKYPYGGVYWRQAIFYSLLWETVKGENLNRVTFDLIDTKKGDHDSHTVTVRDEDKLFVANLLKQSHNQLQQEDFSTGCESDYCEYCNK